MASAETPIATYNPENTPPGSTVSVKHDGSAIVTAKPTTELSIVLHTDMVLEVGTTEFGVASQVLCATSQVFRAMIGPGSHFKEALERRGQLQSTL